MQLDGLLLLHLLLLKELLVFFPRVHAVAIALVVVPQEAALNELLDVLFERHILPFLLPHLVQLLLHRLHGGQLVLDLDLLLRLCPLLLLDLRLGSAPRCTGLHILLRA